MERRAFLFGVLALGCTGEIGGTMPAVGLGRGGAHHVGSSGVPAPTMPATQTDTIYWLNVNNLTHSGDGTEITAATDQSAGSNTIVKGTTGPTYRATRWGGAPCIEVGSGTILRATGGSAVTHMNGNPAASTEFTVVTVWQPRHHLGIYPWAFDDAASSRGLTCRVNSSAYKPQIYGGTSAGAQATYDSPSPTLWTHNVPKVTTVRRSGGGAPVVVFREDGVNATPVAFAWTGNHDVDYFTVGGQQSFTGQTYYVRHVIVFSRALSDSEVAEWEAYLAWESGFVHKLNPVTMGTDWLVVGALGQSNEVGYGTGTYTESVSECYYMGLDGFVRSLVAIDGDGANDASAVLAFATPTGASKHLSMAARMRANGETRKILFVPNAQISTDSVAWKSNLTTSPPTTNDLPCHAKHRIGDALKAPGASLFFSIDQGEANCDNATEAAYWETDWGLVCDELNTYFSGLFEKTTHFVFSRLSLNISGVGAFAANVRTAQDALDAARADVVLYQRPDGTTEGTPGLHLTGAEQQANGVLAADEWDAGT